MVGGGRGKGVIKVLSCHMDRNFNAYFISNFIGIPSSSLFISSRSTRSQILDIELMNKKNRFFRVNLPLLKLQLPLQLSYLQLNYCFYAVHIILINNSFSNNNNVFYNT